MDPMASSQAERIGAIQPGEERAPWQSLKRLQQNYRGTLDKGKEFLPTDKRAGLDWILGRFSAL